MRMKGGAVGAFGLAAHRVQETAVSRAKTKSVLDMGGMLLATECVQNALAAQAGECPLWTFDKRAADGSVTGPAAGCCQNRTFSTFSGSTKTETDRRRRHQRESRKRCQSILTRSESSAAWHEQRHGFVRGGCYPRSKAIDQAKNRRPSQLKQSPRGKKTSQHKKKRANNNH